MKNFLLTIVALLGFATFSSAQCGDELMKQALSAMGNYQYIKDFDIKLASGAADGITFSVVLSSRTKYQMNIANGSTNSENVSIQINDSNGTLVGTNTQNGKVFNAFIFNCSKTGAYKLKVSTPGGSEACARAVLSLVKQYTASEMP
ncbi:MAG: hypothetical protein HUJ96_04960 [Marinilabiliaceae bacterium]|nr:hypothetical protein [Marinilabiliaceae bacterium]